jgi:hypothetical protein
MKKVLEYFFTTHLYFIVHLYDIKLDLHWHILLLFSTAVHDQDPEFSFPFYSFFLQELPVLLQLWISITDTVFPIVGSYILFICLFLLTSYRRFFLLLLLGTVWKLQGKI